MGFPGEWIKITGISIFFAVPVLDVDQFVAMEQHMPYRG